MTRLLPRLLLLAALWPAPALADGRDLYQGFQTFVAGDGATDTGRPASLVACASCHGAAADGGREGNSSVPSVRWTSLMHSVDVGAPYRSDSEVLAAITSGIGRGGAPLGPLMPRYALTPAEGQSLITYLKLAGTVGDSPSGVSPYEVRLGALLPLTGPMAQAGKDILAGMSEVFDATNRRSGINGRRISLVTADSAPGGADGASKLLAAHVYATVGSLWPPDGEAVESLFASRHVAMIASLSPASDEPSAAGWSSDLLPPLRMQNEALFRAVLDCATTGARLIVSTYPGKSEGPVLHVATVAEARRALKAQPAGGCVGYEAGNLEAMGQIVPAAWQQRVVLPFPSQLASVHSSPWRGLGIASARVALEALSAAGAALNEHSLLDQLPQLSGFEPFPGTAVRYSERRRFGWNPEILVLGRTGQFTDARE